MYGDMTQQELNPALTDQMSQQPVRMKTSREAFMDAWELYLDESYNDDHTLCIGGFLAPRDMWDAIGKAWRERLDYENRRSTKRKLPAIRRYHATDVEGGNKEFSPRKGWPRDRRKLLSRRMCAIIADAGPCGIVVGGHIDEIKNHIDPASDIAKETLYDICFRMALNDAEQVMRLRFPGKQFRVIYDDSNYGKYIRRAAKRMETDPGAAPLLELFIGAVPGDSVVDLELQAADLLAYEGFKLLNDRRRDDGTMRLGLRKLLGKKTPIQITRFTDQNFHDMRQMIDNIKAGVPTGQGITSKLEVSVGGLEPLGLVINNS